MVSPPKRLLGEEGEDDSDIEYECIGLNELEKFVPENDERVKRVATSTYRRTMRDKEIQEDPEMQPLDSCADILKFLPEESWESNDEQKDFMELLSSDQSGVQLTVRPPLVIVYKVPPPSIPADLLVLKQVASYRLQILQFLFQTPWTDLTTGRLYKLCTETESLLIDAGLHTWSPYVDERATVVMQDRISHFLLRLAFAEDSTAQEWFIQQESHLLQVKLWTLARTYEDEPTQDDWVKALEPVLQSCGIKYEIIQRNPNSTDSNERKLWEDIRKSLVDVSTNKTRSRGPPNTVLKIPFFPDAAPIARHRRCFLKGGYGYVAVQEVEQVILSHFRRILINSFKMLKEKTSFLQGNVFSDPHAGPLLRSLAKSYTGVPPASQKKTSLFGEIVTVSNIDKLSARSFPPCMRLLYTKLKENKHLRHWGRLQLWLFLKGCGMSLDDQLYWWRSVWNEPDKFDKEVRYNIRHAYGQEGKRVSYSAFNCSKIISGNPAPGHGEHHGCPFRHFDSDPLKRYLGAHYRIPLGSMDSIIRLKESQQYQLSCQQLFKLTHPRSEADGVGNHPNSYFAESCRCYAPKDQSNSEQLQTAESSSSSAIKQEDQKMIDG